MRYVGDNLLQELRLFVETLLGLFQVGNVLNHRAYANDVPIAVLHRKVTHKIVTNTLRMRLRHAFHFKVECRLARIDHALVNRLDRVRQIWEDFA